MNEHILALVARVVEWCEPPEHGGRGHPPTETVRVLGKRKPTPTFRRGLELSRLAISGGGVGGVGERGVIRGA